GHQPDEVYPGLTQGRSANRSLKAHKTTLKSKNNDHNAVRRLTQRHPNRMVVKFQPSYAGAKMVSISYT
ncbi:TPA: hypothetical protein ACQ39K_004924, partial [Yersinia enterocolitica]